MIVADEFLRQQRRYKTGLFRFLLRTRFLVALTAPVIYLGWIPFLLMDLFVSLYQAVCFPIYRIPKVRRADYLVFDREDLPCRPCSVYGKEKCFRGDFACLTRITPEHVIRRMEKVL